MRKDLTSQQRITLGALVVIDVHAKDVIERLMLENCSSITEFRWISHLRYYFEELQDNDIQLTMKMVNAHVNVKRKILSYDLVRVRVPRKYHQARHHPFDRPMLPDPDRRIPPTLRRFS